MSRVVRMSRTVLGMSPSQTACITQLIEAYGRMETVLDRTDTTTLASKTKCRDYLKVLESAAETLGTECANRDYRAAFTANYKNLFGEQKQRNYRVDIFDASTQRQDIIYVNGEQFELSDKTLIAAEELQEAWEDLGIILKACFLQGPSAEPMREIKLKLVKLDTSWACFENAYVLELIDIEIKARSIVVKAFEQEQLLTMAEDNKSLNCYVEPRRREFVETIARINSRANHSRKGRDDLDASILERAMDQLLDPFCGSCDNKNGNVALMLARDITNSFDAIRAYFREVNGCLERVDPHLCNNPGLVEALVDWEASWEIGQKYVQHAAVFEGLSDVIAELARVQEAAPSLKQMRDECDVELFLCIPRLVWLRYLAEPAKCGHLLKNILPHRFSVDGSSQEHSEMKSLQELYQSSCQHLGEIFQAQAGYSQQMDDGGLAVSRLAWKLMVRRAVVGTDGAKALYDELLPTPPQGQTDELRPAMGRGEAAKAALEGLMLELERWSMELQRHAPEDWNQCSSLLVQCLLGETDKPGDQAQFNV